MGEIEEKNTIELSDELLESIPGLDNLVKNFDEKSLAKDSLKMFMLYTDPFANSPGGGYVLQPFHRKIIDVLEKVERGEIKRLMINVPPQHGKSSLSSVGYAARRIGRNQYQNIALGSYSAELSEGFSRKTRELLRSPQYKAIFGDILSPDSQSVTERNTKVGGSYRAVGVGGSLTGKPADCLTGETIISTEKGDMSIRELVRKSCKFKAFSYNHNTGEVELKPILASRKLNKNDIYKITLSSGNTIRATSDHRVWVSGQGYKPTKELLRGDTVNVLNLLKDNNEEFSSSKESNTEMSKGYVLLSEMFFGVIKKTILKALQSLLMTMNKVKTVLFGGMQKEVSGRTQETKEYRVSLLSQIIQTIKLSYKILFYGMQEQTSFGEYDVKRKLKLQTLNVNGGISKSILGQKIRYIKERLIQVYSLWKSQRFNSSSQRQKSYEQGGQQSHNCLQTTSFNTPQLKTDTISRIELENNKEEVYDIQVKDNCNFFANGILVHNCIIIDDPHKDLEEAKSDTMRNKVWDWYTSVVLSRAHINTAIVIIMTRRHEDDLCGRLLEREKDDWVVLNIPVFNEDGTVIRPDKHPKELIDKKRQTVGEAQFQALYMGDPINEGGGAFKKEYFQYYEKGDIIENRKFAKDMQVVTFVDPAISQKQTADSTALVTVGLDKYNNNIYILDIRRGKMLPKEIIDNIFDIVHIRNPQKVGIETNQFQKMLELEIRKEMNSRGKYFQLEGLPSTMNKEAKIISALQGRYSNASILHLKNGMNVNELEAQLLKFPNGKHDDIVDATAMATMLLDSFRLYHKKASVVTMDYSKYL